MIRKGVRETVRKTDEQGVDEEVERGQGKTLGETAGATCQCHHVFSQGIGMNGSRSETIPSQVGVLSHREKRILRRQ